MHQLTRTVLTTVAGVLAGLFLARTATLLAVPDGGSILAFVLVTIAWMSAQVVITYLAKRGQLPGILPGVLAVIACTALAIPVDSAPWVIPWLAAVPAFLALAAVPYVLVADPEKRLVPLLPPTSSSLLLSIGVLVHASTWVVVPPLIQDAVLGGALLICAGCLIRRPGNRPVPAAIVAWPAWHVGVLFALAGAFFATWMRSALQPLPTAPGAWALMLLAWGLAHGCAAPRNLVIHPFASLPITVIAIVAGLWIQPHDAATDWYKAVIASVVVAGGCHVLLRPAYLRLQGEPPGSCHLAAVLGQVFGFALGTLVLPWCCSLPWEVPVLLIIVSLMPWIHGPHRFAGGIGAMALLAFPIWSTFIDLMRTDATARHLARDWRGDYRIERLLETDGSEVGVALQVGSEIRGRELNDQARTGRYDLQSGIGLLLTRLRERHEALRLVQVGSGGCPLAAWTRPADQLAVCEPLSPCGTWSLAPDGPFRRIRSTHPSTELHGSVRLADGALNGAHLLVVDTALTDGFPRYALTSEAWSFFLAHLAADGVIAVQIPLDSSLSGPLLAVAARFPVRTAVFDQAALPQQQDSGSRWVISCRAPDMLAPLRTFCSASITGLEPDLSWAGTDAIGQGWARGQRVWFDRWSAGR